jgi:pSer/pThr/pTyr-binding forkhead associated (FHA) protein
VARVYLEYLGDAVELPIGETVIGRDIGCTLRFNDPSVSRRHLKIIRRHDDVFVEDLQSSNGTLLNNRSVKAPIRVLDGDHLLVGTRELIVRIPDDDEEQTVTLVLTEIAASAGVAQARVATTRMPVTAPPPLAAHQRCPRCGAAVSFEDDDCATCHYRWGGFRAAATTKQTENPLNRRRHERHHIELHLLYISSELEIEATTRDLSTSGVFVCTQVLEPLGTTCELTLLVDGGPPVQLSGVVRRVVERDESEAGSVGLGIEFQKVGDAERAWLEAFVAKRDRAAN